MINKKIWRYFIMAIIDISGQKFGRWIVLERAENTKDGSA